MRLIRYGRPDEERPGVMLPDGTRIDCSAFDDDWDEDFFDSDGLVELEAWLAENEDSAPRVPDHVRLGSAVARPSKIICIGLNYKKHAAETNTTIPEEPIFFFKSTTALCGPNDALVMPRGGTKVDWEVEMGFVVGKRASYVPLDQAMDHVAGFVLHNDYSERAFQLERKGQWVKGKSCDTFAPIGPWLATKDEIADFRNLRLWCRVNGETVQDSNTGDMAYDVPYLVHYISQFMTLLPGDIVSTGTPSGVGLAMDPPRFLGPGDVVEVGIDGLGQNRQVVVRETDG